jgi:hypothetical protein
MPSTGGAAGVAATASATRWRARQQEVTGGGVVRPKPREAPQENPAASAQDAGPDQAPDGGRQPTQERPVATPPDGQAPKEEQPSAAPPRDSDQPVQRLPCGPTPVGATGAAAAIDVPLTPHVTANPFPKPRPSLFLTLFTKCVEGEFSEVLLRGARAEK